MAGFFDDLGKRLSETANDLGKKAEDTLEIQKRKSDIRFLSRANDRDYMDIGKIIFEKYRNGEVVDTDMAALCEAIDQRNEEVTKIQAEIDRINGVATADATEEEEVFEVQTISGSCSSYLWNGSLSEEPRREMCKTR